MRLHLTLLFLTLFLAACQAFARPYDTADLPSGSLLFRDDFSDPASGWERISTADGALDYADGAYRIRVDSSYLMLWAGPGLNFDDARIQATATQQTGPMDDNFGIVCRSQDRENFYFFAISSDGYYGIGKVKEGIQQLIGMELMLPSEDILRGKAANQLRADCVAEHLTLYVNEVRLASVQDSDFSSGGVGLLAGTFAEPGTDVVFDDFTVLKP